jgi:ABC-2 type transport system ATP-binding protein
MNTIIEFKNVTKNYGNILAVEDVSFALNKGEILGFLGPNGAGKTTAMKLITGYMPANKGSVLVNGRDIRDNPLDARKSIGYLPENNPLYTDMTVTEYLDFIAQMRQIKDRRKAVENAMEKCGIKTVSHRIIGHLSKGYRQRVGLAQAILHNPEILILDEPVNGLDPKQITEIRTLIKELGKEKSVILCSHILSEVEAVADRVLIINKGKIVADDTIENLKERSKGNNIFIIEFLEEEKDAKDVVLKLENISKVEQFTNLTLKITASGEKETGHLLFKTAVENNWKVAQLYLESNSLENMFLTLTEIGGGEK